jgi:hypothetical protein
MNGACIQYASKTIGEDAFLPSLRAESPRTHPSLPQCASALSSAVAAHALIFASVLASVVFAIEACTRIIAEAPVEDQTHDQWLDRLWEAHQNDEIPYIEVWVISGASSALRIGNSNHLFR